MNQPNVGSTNKSEISIVTTIPMLSITEKGKQEIQIPEDKKRSKVIGAGINKEEFVYIGGVEDSNLKDLIEKGVFSKEARAKLIENKSRRPNERAKTEKEEQR